MNQFQGIKQQQASFQQSNALRPVVIEPRPVINDGISNFQPKKVVPSNEEKQRELPPVEPRPYDGMSRYRQTEEEAEYDDYGEEDVDMGYNDPELDAAIASNERRRVFQEVSPDTFDPTMPPMVGKIKPVISSKQDDDYASPFGNEDDETDNSVLEDYAQNMASFSYMPKNFLGMKTSDLGFHINGMTESPFMTLKNKIINEASSLKVEDRMQAVRYLSSIPYNNGTYHCVEAAMSIIKDESIDIYKRFYFFENKDKYFRLDDHVVNFLHGGFFKYGMKMGAHVVPVELMKISAEYILKHYDSDTPIRQQVINWVLDTVENFDEDLTTRIGALFFLKTYGDSDEQSFADAELEDMSISSKEDFDIDEREKLAQDFMRAIVYKPTVILSEQEQESTIHCLMDDCLKAASQEYPESCGVIEAFFANLAENPTRFVGVSMHKLIYYIASEYINIRIKDKYSASELIRQINHTLTDETLSDDATELVISLLLSFDNIIIPKAFSLGPTIFEQLRNDVFQGLTASLMGLNEGLRKDVDESRNSQDKSACKEFLVYFDDEKYLMYKNNYKDKMTQKEFEEHFDRIATEWCNY